MNPQQIEQDIYNTFAGSVTVPNCEPLDKWCKHDVFLPSPPFNPGGYLDLSASPYLIQPLLDLQNPKIREVVAVGNPRSGKTLISQAFTLYTIKEDPADILLAVHKKDSIKNFYDIRILPLLKANKIKFADERFNSTKRLIKFEVGSLRTAGAQNSGDFTQLGHRVLIGDEVWEWKSGMLEQFKRRADDFRYTKKILLISQASETGTDFHKEYLKGNQAVWGFKCPHCGTNQTYHFTFKRHDGKYAGFRFDEIRKDNGEWDIPAAAQTARYECIECQHKFYDTDKDRRLLNDCGLYIDQNKSFADSIRSYSWNAFCTRNISYESIASSYLEAKQDVDRLKYDNIQNFHQQVLSNFYHLGLNDEKVQLTVGEVGEDGPDGLRFMGVDVQASCLYYTVISYYKEKKTIQLLTYGKTAPDDWNTIQKVQLDNRVSFNNVLVDSGFNSTQVYRACANHSKIITDARTKRKMKICWCATKGTEPAEGSYLHKDGKYKLYSPIRTQEVVEADKVTKTFCKLTLFATSPVRSLLQELLDQKHPSWKFLFTEEAEKDEVFKAHLNVDKLETVFSPRSNKHVHRWVNPTREDNHYADCLNLGILAGVIVGYL